MRIPLDTRKKELVKTQSPLGLLGSSEVEFLFTIVSADETMKIRQGVSRRGLRSSGDFGTHFERVVARTD